MKHNYKTAIITYPNSNNLGDYIQKIASKQFLNEDIIEIDRDNLNNYSGEKIKLILNGWFMENPKNWPPSDNIIPFFISFHINPIIKSFILNSNGIEYLKKHEPIGCRDLYTKSILEEKGIKAYFSGCLTLALNRKKLNFKIDLKKGILVINVIDRILPKFLFLKKPSIINFFKDSIQGIKYPYKKIKYIISIRRIKIFLKNQKKEIKFLSQIIDVNKTSVFRRNKLAYDQLYAIANSELVLTSRIHSALPSVALSVPTIFISDGLDHINQKSRLLGLDKFFTIIKSKELNKISIDNIMLNNNHKIFVEKMKTKIINFVNYQ
jgi:hypothetical protein